MKLFEAINVWRRGNSGEMICYRCFRVQPSGEYCVQSADCYHSSDAAGRQDHERQFLELFSELDPDARSGSFTTLDEAIHAFEREFGNEA